MRKPTWKGCPRAAVCRQGAASGRAAHQEAVDKVQADYNAQVEQMQAAQEDKQQK